MKLKELKEDLVKPKNYQDRKRFKLRRGIEESSVEKVVWGLPSIQL